MSYAIWIGVILIIIAIIIGLVAISVWHNNNKTGFTSSDTTNTNTSSWIGGIIAVVFIIIGIGLILYGYSEGTPISIPFGASQHETIIKDLGHSHEVNTKTIVPKSILQQSGSQQLIYDSRQPIYGSLQVSGSGPAQSNPQDVSGAKDVIRIT